MAAAAIAEALAYARTGGATTPMLAGCVCLGVGGVALVVGIGTPLAAMLIGSSTAAVGLSLLPAPVPSPVDGSSTLLFVVMVASAIVLLGPGAYSLDSYLFGRREIVIAARPPRV